MRVNLFHEKIIHPAREYIDLIQHLLRICLCLFIFHSACLKFCDLVSDSLIICDDRKSSVDVNSLTSQNSNLCLDRCPVRCDFRTGFEQLLQIGLSLTEFIHFSDVCVFVDIRLDFLFLCFLQEPLVSLKILVRIAHRCGDFLHLLFQFSDTVTDRLTLRCSLFNGSAVSSLPCFYSSLVSHLSLFVGFLVSGNLLRFQLLWKCLSAARTNHISVCKFLRRFKDRRFLTFQFFVTSNDLRFLFCLPCQFELDIIEITFVLVTDGLDVVHLPLYLQNVFCLFALVVGFLLGFLALTLGDFSLYCEQLRPNFCNLIGFIFRS